MADSKTIARVEKLLRTAAPNSGASENERQIAAVEAAKLIAEHGLAITQPPPPSPKKRSPPAPSPWSNYRPPVVHRDPDGTEHSYYDGAEEDFSSPAPAPPRYEPFRPQYDPFRRSGSDWRECVIEIACWCVICGHPLKQGDRAFHDELQGFRCYDIGCG